jgi:LEA14-like dessication related protein
MVGAHEKRSGRRAALAVVLIAVGGGGCATLGKLYFTEPDVQLKEIDVTGISLSGGSLNLVFDVYNPNTYRIRSTRLQLGLDLENTHFGDALLEKPLDLSPQNHNQVVVPVLFQWAGVGAGARALLTRQGLRYGLTGTVFLDTPLGDRRVTLHGSGDVPLKKLLP